LACPLGANLKSCQVEFAKKFWGLTRVLTKSQIRRFGSSYDCVHRSPRLAGEPASPAEGLRLLSFDTLFSCQGALAPSQGTQHNSLSPGFGFAGKPGCSAHPIAPSAAMPPSQYATADREL